MIWRQNGRVNIMTLRDPAGGLRAQQAVFLGGNEVMVEIGDWVYVADFAAKRMGPVTQGQKSIALTGAYAKRVDFD